MKSIELSKWLRSKTTWWWWSKLSYMADTENTMHWSRCSKPLRHKS
jgi:hypothetical protein